MINTSYDIDGSILKPNEPVDSFLNDPKNRFFNYCYEGSDVSSSFFYTMDEKTFNLSGSGYLGRRVQNPFEHLITKYDAFFGNETTVLHQKIEIMNQKKDLMLQMRNAIKGLEMERQVEQEFRVGQILIDQYRHYKKF